MVYNPSFPKAYQNYQTQVAVGVASKHYPALEYLPLLLDECSYHNSH